MPVTTFLTLLITVLLASALTIALAFWANVPLILLSLLALIATLVLRGLHAPR
jgi:hypothetical protein